MALAKIKFTNKETKKTQSLQKTFGNKSDAEYWLNQFNASHLKVHSRKIIAGKDFLEMRLKQARKRALRR